MYNIIYLSIHYNCVGWICNSTCRDGFWGKTCNKTCDCGSATIPCNQATGVCHCPPGRKTDNKNGHCSASCPNGTYGYGCEDSCLTWNAPTEGGNTNKSEKPQMVKTYILLAVMYLAPEKTCDPVTGNRICSPGYTGLNCWNSCPLGTYGFRCSGHCQCANGDCNHVTGKGLNIVLEWEHIFQILKKAFLPPKLYVIK